MSTYKEIRGLKVRDYTTNPDNPIEGQLWYNKTDQVGRYEIPNLLASWRTGNNLNQDRYGMMSSGTVTASIAFGGRISPPNAFSALNESYNGTNWTEVNDLNTNYNIQIRPRLLLKKRNNTSYKKYNLRLA